MSSVSSRVSEGLRALADWSRPRTSVLLLADGTMWFAGLAIATALRYDLELGRIDVPDLLAACALLGGTASVVGIALGVYRRRFAFGTFDEAVALAKMTAAALVVLSTVNRIVVDRWVPVGASLMGPVVAVGGICCVRVLGRQILHRLQRPSPDTAKRLLVVGAGRGGTQTITSLLRNPRATYVPVGIVDDDPRKQNLRISGVPVLGTRKMLVEAANRCRAEAVLVAVPSAESAVVRDVIDRAATAGLPVKILPTVAEIMDGRSGKDATVTEEDIREVTEVDILGRREISTDLASIAGYLSGRRVLVTGAGGSIGRELCRQIRRWKPATLVLVDRDESALHATQLELEGRALLDRRELVVADIRDAARIREVFAEHRPEVVFHAAALKHLPLLQLHPSEGVKTNIAGTLHVLDAAAEFGVERFVNISTDKAANPVSVLGYTKRLAERLTASTAEQTGRPYLSVRFGNVLGSRGSVVPAFKAQIAAGGPVTVTDPEVTRYFMTIEEAVELVIQAGAIGAPGEVLILDMGEPVRIVDVARRLVAASGKSVPIVFTGLRPGEKLHEDLVGEDEVGVHRGHPLITHAVVPPVGTGVLALLFDAGSPAQTTARLAAVCNEGGTLMTTGAVRLVGAEEPRRDDDERVDGWVRGARRRALGTA